MEVVNSVDIDNAFATVRCIRQTNKTKQIIKPGTRSPVAPIDNYAIIKIKMGYNIMAEYSTPHTVRVEIKPGEIYCLIVSNPDNTKSFFMIHESIGDPVFMFSCKTESDIQSAEIARRYAIMYIPETWE
jgi:hypothetical protein